MITLEISSRGFAGVTTIEVGEFIRDLCIYPHRVTATHNREKFHVTMATAAEADAALNILTGAQYDGHRIYAHGSV